MPSSRPTPANIIRVVGAREHNLRDVSLDIPRDDLVVITGLSGSGKSSLAFDTLYAEGQRRYVESLSAYARQFLGQMDKPDVDHIEGLSPAISIDQKTTSRNPRSTVATVTEIYDYLRLLFARVGEPHCPICGRPIAGQSVEQITDQVLALPEGTRFLVLAPLVRGRKGEHRDVLEQIRAEGFTRVAVDGTTYVLDEVPALDKKFNHTIEVVVDRLVMNGDLRRRLSDSLETATRMADGLVRIEEVVAEGEPRSWTYSEKFACPEHGASLPELAPRTFSFNSPHGACPQCTGLGFTPEVDPELVVDPERSLNDGAVLPWTDRTTDYYDLLLGVIATQNEIDLDTPWKDLPQAQRTLLLDGPRRRERVFLGSARRKGGSWGWFEGVIPQLRRQHATSMSQAVRDGVEQFMSLRPCSACGGARLKPESLAVTVVGRNIHEVCLLAVEDALAFFTGIELTDTQAFIGARVIQEIRERLRFLDDVGVGYLDAGPRRRHALRRRGPADPPCHPDRLGPGGRALHPGRAVDRSAPARQPQADRDARAPARPGQHGPGGGARRGDDPQRRARGRHGPGGGPARRPRGGPGIGRRHRGRALLGDGGVPVGQARGRRARPAPRGPRMADRPRGAREQPPGHRRTLPDRGAHVRHRRLGVGQEHAGQRGAPQVARRPARPPCRGAPGPTTGSRASSTSTR